MSGPQIVLKKGVVKQVSQNLMLRKHFLCITQKKKKKEKPCHATAYIKFQCVKIRVETFLLDSVCIDEKVPTWHLRFNFFFGKFCWLIECRR